MPVSVRKCCFCWDKLPETEMTMVPRNQEIRKKWIEELGERFGKRIEGKKSMYVCRTHFGNLPVGKRRPEFKTPHIETVEHTVIQDRLTIRSLMGEMLEQLEIDELEEENLVIMTDEYEEHEEYVPDIDADELNDSRKSEFDYLLVDFGILMDTLRFCQRCSSREVDFVQHKSVGASLSVTLTCSHCLASWKWSSTRNCSFGRQVNSDISAASTLCGLSYSKLIQFFECLRVPHLTERAHYSIVKRRVAPEIDNAFKEMQRNVVQTVVEDGEETGQINVAGDAMYDTPGFSAIVCRYALLCVETGLVLEVEAMRKERNGKKIQSSKAQEPKALEIALSRLEQKVATSGKDVVIGSITTDRDMSVHKMLSEKFSNIKTWFDIWHFVKNLQKTLWKKRDNNYMLPVKHWIKPMCNHLYHSIASSSGDGALATEKFMSFFLHIQGKHRTFKNVENFNFTRVKRCEHGALKQPPGKYLNLNDAGDKFAYDTLFELSATPKRIDDMKTVSPHWATSQVESFNSLSLLYHPKSRFFSEDGYRMRMQLSVLHWNHLKLEKMLGTREIIGKKSYYSKTHRRLVWKDLFTRGTKKWREEIYQRIRKGSLSSISISDCNDDEIEEEEEIELELEEMILNEFGLEDEREDTDEEDSIDESEAEEVEENRAVWKDEGDLEIDIDEQMEDWSSLIEDKEKRILQFPLKTPSSVLLAPCSSSVSRAHTDILNLYKVTKYSDFVGTEVSSDEE